MKTIAFITLGCKLNYAETSTYERGILRACNAPAGSDRTRPVDEYDTGLANSHPEGEGSSAGSDSASATEGSRADADRIRVVPASGPADAYLVNTCSVTEHSDKKSRNIIRKLHRIAPGAAIFVTGCYAELKRSEIEAIEGVRAVFGAAEKTAVIPAVSALLLSSTFNPDAPQPGGVMFPAYSSGERTRSFLKVQDGCDFRCAYCTVPNARGRSRNIPIAEAVSMAREIASTGIREIVLTGVNTGDFGRTTGESFLDLIRELNEVEGIDRYRISSIEPNLLTEEMVDWIASGTKFLPHFHIPLQSGSDTILRAMGRRYSTADFEHKINYIRSRMEGPAPSAREGSRGRSPVFFGIDVIVGFPGETEELFNETYNFLRDRIRPAFIHIFPYSRRASTPAALRKDQVQDRVKTERVERLEALCSELHAEFIARNKGRRERVLFESAEKDGRMFGYTENYIRVERPFDPALIGRIVDVVL